MAQVRFGDKKKDEATTYSPAFGSTIGAQELNGRVRNGNGCGLLAIITSSICIGQVQKVDSGPAGAGPDRQLVSVAIWQWTAGPDRPCAGQSTKALRAISTAWLNMLPCVHLPPINLVVFQGPWGNTYLGVGFALRCFQRLIPSEHSYPAMHATTQQVH